MTHCGRASKAAAGTFDKLSECGCACAAGEIVAGFARILHDLGLYHHKHRIGHRCCRIVSGITQRDRGLAVIDGTGQAGCGCFVDGFITRWQVARTHVGLVVAVVIGCAMCRRPGAVLHTHQILHITSTVPAVLDAQHLHLAGIQSVSAGTGTVQGVNVEICLAHTYLVAQSHLDPALIVHTTERWYHGQAVVVQDRGH